MCRLVVKGPAFRRMAVALACVGLLAPVAACGDTERSGGPGAGSGGAAGAGMGGSAQGGTDAGGSAGADTGGTSAAAGTPSALGGNAGSLGVGGATNTGGTTNTGGAANTGGTANTGGSAGSAADDCGGCAAGSMCIYQVGGPGPSRWLCAQGVACPQPCACIEGQGGCTFVPRTGEPGYCSCDNGLE